MKVKNYHDTEGFENMHSIEKAAKLQDSSHTKIIHMELQPGDVVKPHKTPVDVSFFIIQGLVEIKIGDEKETAGEGSLVESPANVTHAFTNDGSQKARVLVIKHLKSEV